MKVAFYAYQNRGLGHIVRSANLIGKLQQIGGFSLALVAGTAWYPELPPEVDLIRLPPASEPLHLPEAVSALQLRSEKICAFCRRWEPDCLIVDHLPLGLGAELLPVLDAAATEGWKTRFAIGIPYREGMNLKLGQNPRVARAYGQYSFGLGYTEQEIEPVLEELTAFPVLTHLEYIGVITPSLVRPRPEAIVESSGKCAVVLCGGGYATPRFFDLVEAACRLLLRQAGMKMYFVAGPLAERIGDEQRRTAFPEIEVLREGRAEDWATRADVVIARCGYNTSYTVMQGSVPAIFVPLPGNDPI